MKKILIINPFGIGDVLFTTPLIKNLKLAYPTSEIHFLSNSRSAAVLADNPAVSKILLYDRDAFKEASRRSPWAYLEKGKRFFEEIRRERYDLALDLSMDRGLGFLTAIAGIPQRLGFDYKGRGTFLTRRIPLRGYEGKHVVEYYLDFLRELGVPVVDKTMELVIPARDEQWAKEWFRQKALIFAKPLIAVFPGGGASWGSSAKLKRWPVEKYAKLTDKMIEKYNAHIILLGSEGERELCHTIAEQFQSAVYVAAGELTITQSAALIKQCSLVVCSDGGPLHVAVASGVPTVSIFGPVNDAIYGPYPLGKHVVVKKGLACQPCYRRFRMADCSHINCLGQLSVDEVFKQTERFL